MAVDDGTHGHPVPPTGSEVGDVHFIIAACTDNNYYSYIYSN